MLLDIGEGLQFSMQKIPGPVPGISSFKGLGK